MDTTALEPSQAIEIEYEGGIAESYPAQIFDCVEIRRLGWADERILHEALAVLGSLEEDDGSVPSSSPSANSRPSTNFSSSSSFHSSSSDSPPADLTVEPNPGSSDPASSSSPSSSTQAPPHPGDDAIAYEPQLPDDDAIAYELQLPDDDAIAYELQLPDDDAIAYEPQLPD